MDEKKLIDADNFAVRMDRAVTEFMNRVGMPKKYRLGLRASIVTALYDQPAVDAIPVMRGYWLGSCGEHILPDTDGKVWSACNCSCCGKYLGGSGEYAVNGRFCPSCGSRMDELFGKTEQLNGGDSNGKLDGNG